MGRNSGATGYVYISIAAPTITTPILLVMKPANGKVGKAPEMLPTTRTIPTITNTNPRMPRIGAAMEPFSITRTLFEEAFDGLLYGLPYLTAILNRKTAIPSAIPSIEKPNSLLKVPSPNGTTKVKGSNRRPPIPPPTSPPIAPDFAHLDVFSLMTEDNPNSKPRVHQPTVRAIMIGISDEP